MLQALTVDRVKARGQNQCSDNPSSSLCVQSKIHAARSLNEIAIDLTETGTLKTSKLANMGSKGKIISGSSGSLLSSGQFINVCACAFECALGRTKQTL